MKNQRVIGIGEILWDLLPEGRQLGGAPANFAFHARQLGQDAAVISAVGEDEAGKDITQLIKQYGLRNFIAVNKKPTGTVSVKLDPQGIPNYIINENVAWDFIDISDDAMTFNKETDAICFGSLAQRSGHSRQAIWEVLEQAGEKCLKVFDINLRQHFYTPQIINRSLKLANILKINDDELAILGKMFDLGQDDKVIVRNVMRKFNLTCVALTMGSKGSWLFSGDQESWVDTPVVKVADTVGAGDSFTAAMVTALLKGKSLKDTHKLAVEVSAFVCTQKGATPVLPDKFRNL